MSKQVLARLALAAAVVLVLALPAAAAVHNNGDNGGSRSDRGLPSIQHIFVIMLENHSQSSVIGDANAPFINSLAQSYATAANYYGVTHPSEPNYVAAISGSNWFVNNDNPANRFDHTNLVDQLEASHHTWGAYMESMPSAGYLGDFYPSSAEPALRVEAQPVRALRRHPQRPVAAPGHQAVHAARDGSPAGVDDARLRLDHTEPVP